MASTNITLSAPAYDLLKKLKKPGQSFSEVILELAPCQTAGDILDYFEKNPPPPANEKLMKEIQRGRGRRSRRP